MRGILLLQFLAASTLLFSPAYAATRTAESTGGGVSGEAVYWIILTVVLTLLFTMRGMIASLFANPIMVLCLIGLIVLSYILWKAIEIAYGIDSAIDSAISNTADLLR